MSWKQGHCIKLITFNKPSMGGEERENRIIQASIAL